MNVINPKTMNTIPYYKSRLLAFVSGLGSQFHCNFDNRGSSCHGLLFMLCQAIWRTNGVPMSCSKQGCLLFSA